VNCSGASSVVADKKLHLGGKGRDGLMLLLLLLKLLLLLLKLLLFELQQLGESATAHSRHASARWTHARLAALVANCQNRAHLCAQLLILMRLLSQRSLDRVKVERFCRSCHKVCRRRFRLWGLNGRRSVLLRIARNQALLGWVQFWKKWGASAVKQRGLDARCTSSLALRLLYIMRILKGKNIIENKVAV
jgi:hypothetical protein